MKANSIVDALGNIVVQMQGDISVDTTVSFREQISGLVKNNPTANVAIDMAALEFVGSSGISHFVETLKIIRTKRSSAITLKNVDPDFVNKRLKSCWLAPIHSAGALHDSYDPDFFNKKS